MVPQTYPSVVNSDGDAAMVVYFLSSVSGLVRWTDYIPVKVVLSGSFGKTDADGYILFSRLTSITGKTAFGDYVPVFEDFSATEVWVVNDTGFIPYGYDRLGQPDFLLMETGFILLMEDGSRILLE